MLDSFLEPGALAALFQVLMIDLVLAGDNAVAVGLAAGGLPQEQRKKAIFYGLIAAVVTRIGFALITTELLGIIGLLLAGGLLLLWVCWKMWREMRDHARAEEVAANAAMDDDPSTERCARAPYGPGAGLADVDRPDGRRRSLDRPPAPQVPLDWLRRPGDRALRRPAYDVAGSPAAG